MALVSILLKMNGEKLSLQSDFQVREQPDANHIKSDLKSDDTPGRMKKTGRIASGYWITPNTNAWQARTLGTTCNRITVKMIVLVVNVF